MLNLILDLLHGPTCMAGYHPKQQKALDTSAIEEMHASVGNAARTYVSLYGRHCARVHASREPLT